MGHKCSRRGGRFERLQSLLPRQTFPLPSRSEAESPGSRWPASGLMADPEEVGNGGRVRWVSGSPGEAPAYAGTDFILARGGLTTGFSHSLSGPTEGGRSKLP